MRAFFLCGLLAGLTVAGCSDAPPKTIANQEKYAALQELSGDTLMMVGPDASMGKWAAVKKAASSPQFAEKVSHFEKAEIPAGIPDGAALKEKVVKALQGLMFNSKMGDNSTLEAAWKELQTAIANLNAAAEGRKAG